MDAHGIKDTLNGLEVWKLEAMFESKFTITGHPHEQQQPLLSSIAPENFYTRHVRDTPVKASNSKISHGQE